MEGGDPACDLTIAWTFLPAAPRAVFRAALGLDDATWARARGWALWNAVITLAAQSGTNPAGRDESRRALAAVLDEAAAERRA